MPGKDNSFLSVVVNTKAYNSSPVLSSISFSVPKGSFISILGPSGCGKTTLLRMIAGLDNQYDGAITVDGNPINGPAHQVGIMFQEARLLGWKTVEQNIAFALPKNINPARRRQMVGHALDLVGLSSARTSWPSQISGGMERRTALARAIVNLPSLLLLDEPFSALDYANKIKLWNEIEDIHQRENLTTLLVTHDMEEALYLSDIMIFLGGNPATITQQTRVDIARPRAKFMADIGVKRTQMIAPFL